MIIYLYGSDSYRRQEKLNWYLDQFKAKHSGLSVEKFDLAEAGDSAKLKDFISAQSLFAKVKLGVVSNIAATDSKEIIPVLKPTLEDKSITLIISEDKKLPKDFTFLAKAYTIAEFAEPSDIELRNFIQKEAEKRSVKLSPASTDALIAVNNADVWGIINDLNKLELGGSLDEHIAAQNFWGLISKIKRNDIAALTWLLETEEPAKVFNMIASGADADFKTKMADYDVAIKSGKLEYEEALLAATLGG